MDHSLGLGLSGRMGNEPIFLFRDLFTTDRAAGAVHGSAAEPGLGTRTVVDAESKLTISGGKLVFAGGKAAPVLGDPGLWGELITRAAGRAVLAKITSTNIANTYEFGWDTNQNGALGANHIRIGSSIIRFYKTSATPTTIGTPVNGAEYKLAVILKSSGSHVLIKGDAFTEWTLLWEADGDATANLYPAIINTDAAYSADNLCIADLAAPWNDDFGIASQRLAGARSQGDVFVHESNFLLECTIGNFSAGGIELQFRIQDSNINLWQIETNAAGDLKLAEIVDSVRTVRGNVSGVIGNGDKIVVIAEGSTIKVFSNDVLRLTYASATNFQTETDGKLKSKTAGVTISDIVTWPRTLSGAALSVLQRYAG